MTKWVNRHIFQEMCPWNVRCSKELPEGSSFAAREMFVAKDARALAREILVMDQADYAAAFNGSAVERQTQPFRTMARFLRLSLV